MTTTYAYDHAGTRVKIATGGATTYYPNKAYNFTPTVQSTDIYLSDIVVTTAQTTAGNTTLHYNDTDHLKSSSFGTDISGNQEQVLEYYPYGEIALNTKAGAFDQKRKYIGQIYDDSTGLNYLNARYYDANRGQFVSQDPVFWEIGQSKEGKEMLLNPQAQNSYSYAGNNPIRNSDPTGKCFWDGCIAEVTALVGTLAMYAPQITSFLQGLTTPLGQLGLSQAAEDAHKGNYGWAAFGALTAGELPQTNIVKGLWTETKARTSIENAIHHFGKHGEEFGVQNAKQYVEKAREFFNNPPTGTLIGNSLRDKNSNILYHEASNTLGVINKQGVPQTFYKPDTMINKAPSNLDFFKSSVSSFTKIIKK